jgi:hypothetical protein
LARDLLCERGVHVKSPTPIAPSNTSKLRAMFEKPATPGTAKSAPVSKEALATPELPAASKFSSSPSTPVLVAPKGGVKTGTSVLSLQISEKSKPAEKSKPSVLRGELAEATPESLFEGMKNIGVPVQFGQRNLYMRRLQAQDKPINSYEEAVHCLFGDDPSAVELANASTTKKSEARAAAAEKARQKAVIQARYPSGQIGTYYRGDTRTVEELARGFEARRPLTLDQARAQARTWFGPGAGPTAHHEDWIRDPKAGDKVACGNSVNCEGHGILGPEGAQNGTNVYQISVPGLREVHPTREALGVAPHAKQGPKLIMNADRIEHATIIGVSGVRAAETTFLTSLHPNWLTQIYQSTAGTPDPKEQGKFIKVPGRGWLDPL